MKRAISARVEGCVVCVKGLRSVKWRGLEYEGRRGKWKCKKVHTGAVGKVMKSWQSERGEINEFVEEKKLCKTLKDWCFKSSMICDCTRRDDLKRLD